MKTKFKPNIARPQGGAAGRRRDRDTRNSAAEPKAGATPQPQCSKDAEPRADVGENASIDVPHSKTLEDTHTELSGEATQEQVTPSGHADATLPSADQARTDASTSSSRESEAVLEDSAVPLAGKKTAQQSQASGGETPPTSEASIAPSTVRIRGENANTSPGAQTEHLDSTTSNEGIPASNASSSLIEGTEQELADKLPSVSSEDGAARSKRPAKRKRGSRKTTPTSGEEVGEKSPNPKRQRGSSSSRKTTPTPGVCDEAGEKSPNPKKQRSAVARVREAPDRSTMTMQELIYYNPTANPMSARLEDLKRRKEDGTTSKSVTPTPPADNSRAGRGEDKGREMGVEEEKEEDEEEYDDGGRLVPKLTIGSDGSIVIDEKSMVVEVTHKVSLPGHISEVIEDSGHTTSASYRSKKYKITKWNQEETNKFFKALRQVGTDFTMMTLLLPARSRKELKNKFKKEEKNNPYLISQALTNQSLPKTRPKTS